MAGADRLRAAQLPPPPNTTHGSSCAGGIRQLTTIVWGEGTERRRLPFDAICGDLGSRVRVGDLVRSARLETILGGVLVLEC